MILITDYLNKLLFEQDCVVLPDFGGFISHTNNAYFSTANGKYYPPSKKVAFNEALKLDDGLLTHYVALNEEISHQEAAKKVRSFVDNAKQTLREKGNLEVIGLGNLYTTSENKLAFEPLVENNLMQDAYGLTPIDAKQLENNEADLLTYDRYWSPNNRPIEAPEKIKPFFISRKAVYMTGAVIAGFLFYSSSSLNPSASLKSSLNPFDLFSNTSKTITIPVTKSSVVIPKLEIPTPTTENKVPNDGWGEPAKIETVVKEEAVEKIVQPENTHSYFIIAGAFTKLKNANKLVNYLKENGFPEASVLDTKNKLIKVSAGGFDSERSASKQLADVSILSDSEAWILHKK